MNKIQLYKNGEPLMSGIELEYFGVGAKQILWKNPAYPGCKPEVVGYLVFGYPDDMQPGFTFTQEEVSDDGQ